VAVSEKTTATVDAIRATFQGRITDQDRKPFADFDTPFRRRTNDAFRQMTAKIKELLAFWPGMTMGGYEDASEAAGGDAERKAARRLGVPALTLSVAAHSRYGRSFTAERDRRVAEQAPADAPPRTLQALRGHITRALIAELATALTKGGRG
jgi:hypothetical protein